MIVLGIDPGIATVGFGLVRSENGKPAHIRHGVIRTPAGMELSQRLLMLHEDLNELIEAFKPDAMAVEELFFGNNVTTGINVAHGRGIILLAAAKHRLPVSEYKPSQVKQAVVGYGKAEKQQMMEMTRSLLRLRALPRPDDAADALAVAICHVHCAASLLGQKGEAGRGMK